MSYRHTQTGWPIRAGFGVGAAGLLVMTAFAPFDQPLPRAGLLAGAVLCIVLALVWSRLTVRIDDGRLHWAFGPGWPRFSLPLADIASAESTRTTFWQGWGIHRTRAGWLYNVAGYDAVRIRRKDGKQLLLGTDEPRKLAAAIERALARPPRGRARR
jgi:hypothetical protein